MNPDSKHIRFDLLMPKYFYLFPNEFNFEKVFFSNVILFSEKEIAAKKKKKDKKKKKKR